MDNVDSDNEEEIDNLINGSDRKLIADEEILPSNRTPDTSLTTPEANIHVVRDNENQKSQIKRRKKSHGNGQRRRKLTNKNHVNLSQKYKQS